MTRLRPIIAIAWVTFQELLLQRVFYLGLWIAGALTILAYLLSRLTFAQPERVILDFGLTGLAIANSGLAILLAAPLIPKELERRTAWVVLAHPVSRVQFYLGKWLGLIAVLKINLAITALIYVAISRAVGADWSRELFQSVTLVEPEMILLASFALWLSTRGAVGITVMASIALFLAGHSTSQWEFLIQKATDSGSRVLFQGLKALIPNLDLFAMGLRLPDAEPLSWMEWGTRVLTGAGWVAGFTGLGMLSFQRKDL